MEKMTYQDVKKQSTAVFGQFGESKWIPYAKENAALPNRRDAEELRNCGIGKVLLLVGLGASLEDHIDTIKKYRDKVDIVCVDKAFKPLMERGIKADYVMLCDCNIQWPKWGPREEDTEGVKLIATPYAHTTWTKRWRGPIYFYVNRDAIDSQHIFLDIMGKRTRTIPASSNVSNAQFVFFTGMDEWNRASFSGYEKFLLTGYDYSWRPDGNYYAWNDPRPKRFYMHHRDIKDINNDRVYSSENLIFSARWLSHYLGAWKMSVVNCSGRGLLDCARGRLEDELKAINPAKANSLKVALETVKYAKAAFDNAMASFNLAREELIYGSR